MAYTKTDIANMGDEFAKILLAYNKDVTEATQKAVEEVAQKQIYLQKDIRLT